MFQLSENLEQRSWLSRIYVVHFFHLQPLHFAELATPFHAAHIDMKMVGVVGIIVGAKG
jgi:hypothetical protein